MATPSVTVGAALPGEGYAQALAAIFKAGDDLLNILNSPQMLALRQSQDIQGALSRMDADLKAAQVSGDISTIDTEASG